ncbi:MAG: hypothetical protein JJE50_02760 [Actinomycetales bacterium]|nr:hypothetical protein [Actinomycetales bacterium]
MEERHPLVRGRAERAVAVGEDQVWPGHDLDVVGAEALDRRTDVVDAQVVECAQGAFVPEEPGAEGGGALEVGGTSGDLVEPHRPSGIRAVGISTAERC